MTADRDALYIKHILEAIEKIGQYTKGMGLNRFLKDDKTKSAVIRELEVIGEAAKRLSKTYTKDIDLPWKDIAGMRDKLIHDYMGVDAEVVWETVKTGLPELRKKLT